MRKNVVALLVGFGLLFLGACSSDKDGPNEPGGGPAEDARRTVLVYWVGANDLSDYAISDFNEMLEGMSRVDVSKNNLLVYMQTNDDVPHLIQVTQKINKIVADTIGTYQERNPLEKGNMSEIIARVVEDFPAENYGLVFASHADGWIKSPSTRHWGDYRGSKMDITDMRAVLEEFSPFEFIFFDACYMQAIEVLFELRHCTDYIISSPTEIPGPGAPYQNVLPSVFAGGPEAVLDLARAYYDYYGNDDGSMKSAAYMRLGRQWFWDYGVSVSVVETSKLDLLAEVTKEMITRYVDYGERVSTSGLFRYGNVNSGSVSYSYYDLALFVYLLTEGNEDYLNWKKAFDDVQLYFKTTDSNYTNRIGRIKMDTAEGISMYVPSAKSTVQHSYFQTLDWYDASGWSEVGW